MEILAKILEFTPMVLVLVIFVVAGIIYFNGQKKKAKDWLVWAVSQAEAQLGGGTGKLKLRYVYDLFIGKFPMFSTLISFETFANWVDISLVTMKEYIETNDAIADVIQGDTLVE